jgi:hypothetical protein
MHVGWITFWSVTEEHMMADVSDIIRSLIDDCLLNVTWQFDTE